MHSRIIALWQEIQDSLWFVPAVMTLLATLLAISMVQLDEALDIDPRAGYFWAFGGGSESAQEVLSAIASTMITVIGVVFSVTIIALQLASSQFTPRVLRTFTGDRSNQLVFGVFIASFTYSLLVLRAVRESRENEDQFVPSVSVTVGIILALVSIGFLIFFIHHVARTIQVTVIIDRATSDTVKLIDQLYPDTVGRPASPGQRASISADGPAALIRAEDSGYLQAVDDDVLFDVSEDRVVAMQVEPQPGTFILPGTILATVRPAEALIDDTEQSIRSAFVTGMERTMQSDVAYGINQLTDIAAKALSPSTNDPTTATNCIDRLCDVLVRLANREMPNIVRTGKDGTVRVVLPPPSFEHLVDVALTPPRAYGAGHAIVAAHLLEMLGRVVELVPQQHRQPILHHAHMTIAAAREQITMPHDRERIERAASWLTLSRTQPSSPASTRP